MRKTLGAFLIIVGLSVLHPRNPCSMWTSLMESCSEAQG